MKALAPTTSWRPVGTALERIRTSPLPQDISPAHERVRTNSEATTGKSKNLFHSGRHNWLGLVARDRELSGGGLRVAILIWQHLNETTGYAWPSIPYIARQLGLHRSTVFRSLSDLESHGWVTVKRRAGKHGVNHYRIAFGITDVR